MSLRVPGILRIAVIGLGRISHQHLPALASFPEVTLEAAVDFLPERRAEVGATFGVARQYASVDELLRAGEVEAAWVLTSVRHTVEVAIACLEAGLHVFIEKPPGLCAEETRRMARVAREHGRFSMVGFNRRFHPLVQPALDAVRARGGPAHLLSQWHKNNLPRVRETLGELEAQTLLRNDLIHPLDLLRFCGGEVRQIHGVRRSRFSDFEDAFDALIEFEGGAMGHLVSSHTSPHKIERLQLIGHRMVVELEGADSSFTRGKVTSDDGERELTTVRQSQGLFEPRTDRFGFWDEDRFFVEHLLRNQPVSRPGADLEDALKSMEMADSFQLLPAAR